MSQPTELLPVDPGPETQPYTPTDQFDVTPKAAPFLGPVDEVPFGELLARDFDALARLARTDDNIAQLLSEWPRLIQPLHVWTRNGTAAALGSAIHALRPIAIGAITTSEGTLKTLTGVRVRALIVQVPLRTRTVDLGGRLDDVLVPTVNGGWALHDALVDALSGVE